MRRFLIAFFVLLFAEAGCGGGLERSTPPAPPGLGAPLKPSFAIPRLPALAVPPRPASGARGTAPVSMAAHAAFFNGEVALSNGVYYLKFPNGTPLGYYSYLTDSHYVYHFDLGYEYVFDSADPNAVYMYDFASGHFWYTGANIFPYVYDFTLQSILYYYPDTHQADHYTTNPRYFYDFQTSQIITLPNPLPGYCSTAAAGSCSVTATVSPIANYYSPPLAAGWYRRITFTNNSSTTPAQVQFSVAGCYNVGPGNQFCLGQVIGGVTLTGWLGYAFTGAAGSQSYDLQTSTGAGTNFGFTVVCYAPYPLGQSPPAFTSCP